MKTSVVQLETTVAATVAGEDVACGDFVALLNVTYELPTYLWHGCDAPLSTEKLVRLTPMASESGKPLKVIGICLPFLYVRSASGEMQTLDLRRMQVVRLDRRCAKHIWNEMKQEPKIV